MYLVAMQRQCNSSPGKICLGNHPLDVECDVNRPINCSLCSLCTGCMRRSGWNSEGNAWRAPKVGRCRMGSGMVRSVRSPANYLGSVVSFPGGVRDRAPAENRFWRILRATERSFLYLYDKNLRGQFAVASPYSKFWGTCPPRPPVSYADGCSVQLLLHCGNC